MKVGDVYQYRRSGHKITIKGISEDKVMYSYHHKTSPSSFEISIEDTKRMLSREIIIHLPLYNTKLGRYLLELETKE